VAVVALGGIYQSYHRAQERLTRVPRPDSYGKYEHCSVPYNPPVECDVQQNSG